MGVDGGTVAIDVVVVDDATVQRARILRGRRFRSINLDAADRCY